MATVEKTSTGTSGSNTYLMVPILIFFGLLIFAVIRGPNLISPAGIGSAVIVVAPLILATYALAIICMAGRASVDLSIGPLIGFINVSMIQLHAIGFLESPIAVFLFAMGVGVAYQIVQGLIIIFVRVQPIIVSLSGYLTLVGLNLVILPRPGGVAPPWMFDWGSGTSLFSEVLVILVIATAAWYVLAQTSFFGHLRMMGSDERAAYTSGVRINFVRLGGHAIGGVYAGLAAITFTSLISSGDPSQGTTYTLMAVTALVLGGANLAGGRGGAFGSLLGALNIYLITYALSTFSFGMVQSFITDMAYGVMLVVSLLISVAVPQIRKYIRGLSPLVFFVILSVIALGVIMHTTLDQTVAPLQGVSASAIVILEDGGVAQVSGTGGALYSAGTYILFIIIAAVGLVYLFRTLFRYPSAPMVGLLAVIAVTALGLIFAPDKKPDDAAGAVEAEAAAPEGMDAYSPKFFAMETVDASDGLSTALVDVYQMLARRRRGHPFLVTPDPRGAASGHRTNQVDRHVSVRGGGCGHCRGITVLRRVVEPVSSKQPFRRGLCGNAGRSRTVHCHRALCAHPATPYLACLHCIDGRCRARRGLFRDRAERRRTDRGSHGLFRTGDPDRGETETVAGGLLCDAPEGSHGHQPNVRPGQARLLRVHHRDTAHRAQDRDGGDELAELLAPLARGDRRHAALERHLLRHWSAALADHRGHPGGHIRGPERPAHHQHLLGQATARRGDQPMERVMDMGLEVRSNR